MKIRAKLALLFVGLGSFINLVGFLSIYLSSSNYRQDEFYDRLHNRAVNTAKLLIEVQEIDRNLLRIIDENTILLPQEEIMVYDFNNNELYSNLPDLEPLTEELLNKIRLEETLRFEVNKREFIGILYKGSFDRFVVLASAYDEFGYRKMNNLKWVLIVVFFSSVLIMYLAGWVFSGYVLSPIKKIVEQVGNISDQNLEQRIDEGKNSDELSQLARTFNSMLQRLQEAFMAQKNFVSHASHELRTPLTSLSGQLEVALMADRSKDEYKKILESSLEDLNSLTRLTNGLLMLIKTDNPTVSSHFVPLRVDELLLGLPQPTGSRVIIEFNNLPEDEKDLIVMGDEVLLRSAFLNLIENAAKFSENMPVRVGLSSANMKVTITIADQGKGISPEDIDKIFDPMYRSATAKKIPGHGLGLTITQKVIRLHNGKIHLSSKVDQGTTVEVSLPTSKI